jgi:hypothetical protein
MKAIVVHQYGVAEALKFEGYPDPAAGPGEVLVRVAASNVNPKDYRRRAGETQDFGDIADPTLATGMRFNASRTGGRYSPSPSRPYGTSFRSLRGWDRR